MSVVRAYAPGRTELAGNHTDHQGGRVVAGAVSCGIEMALSANGLGRARVESAGFPPFEIDLACDDPREDERFTTRALVRGVVDYCRIGCDVGLTWEDQPFMRQLQRERVSTRNSFGNTYGRAPLDGRAFGNDPDVFFLRDDVKLTTEQRDELLFANADSGTVLLTSDDMGSWTPEQRMRYQK